MGKVLIILQLPFCLVMGVWIEFTTCFDFLANLEFWIFGILLYKDVRPNTLLIISDFVYENLESISDCLFD